MNLGIFLQPGESFKLMSKVGQDKRFIQQYLEPFSKKFDEIYIFSYLDEIVDLPKNVYLIPKKNNFHRLIYAILLPVIKFKYINKCDAIRGFGFVSGLSSFLTNKKFVVNWAYDYISFAKVERKYLYIPFYFIFEKLIFLRANTVFIATKEKLKKLQGKKFIYLPNGVNINLFRPDNKKRAGLLFIGRLERQKNLFFLLDAISRLPLIQRKVTFVGNGSLKQELIKYAKTMDINLKILDPVPNDSLPELMNAYKALLLPSFHEGSPKVLLEAMSTGLVPIVTNFPTAREVIDDEVDGFITSYNEERYSEKINLILNDDIYSEKLSKNAIKKIKNQFDLEVLINKEIEVLKNV